MATAVDGLAKLRERLAWDTPFYAENCLWIVDKRKKRVPLIPKAEQLRFDAALEAQRAAGKPMRAIILKARQIGFCLAPETRVLTADLRWVALDALEPGQELVATDENVPGGRGRGRKMRRAVIEAKREVREQAFRLTLDNGQSVVATGPHRFLCRKRAAVDTEWRTVDDMRPGDRIRHIAEPWDAPTYEDGWFGGMLDGEGCLRAKKPGGCEITVSQLPGAVYDRACRYLRSRAFTFREDLDERPPKEGGKYGSKAVGKLVCHRTNELFRLVGQTRPSRFLARSDWWEDRDLPGKRSGIAWAQVVAITPLGEQRMVDLQTSTKTFIAEGFVSHNSTWTQGKMLQRVTQRENHSALVVAHDMETAKKLFAMGLTMWRNLPQDPELGMKPQISNRRIGRELHFGNPARNEADTGDVGLDSHYAVGTAKEVEAGRGGTLSDLHGSEVAFWDDIEGKLTGLLESLPDEPETLGVLESTANGFNEFKDRWDDAESGRSEWLAFFSPWFEDPAYSRPFADEYEREAFAHGFGREAIGEDEPMLRERFGLTDEQLNWRRHKIMSSFGGKIGVFKQEYPATALEAFIATGSKVFEPMLVAKVMARAERTDPRVLSDEQPGPRVGELKVTKTAMRRGRHGMVEIPTAFEWVAKGFAPADGDSTWRVWEEPQEGGQYIASMDPSDDEETDRGETAWTAIEVINHRTLEQAAEYRTRLPAALAKVQLYLAALHWNQAFTVVERTGGFGTSILNAIYHDWKYPRPRVYFRRAQGDAKEREGDRLGWYTDRSSKPELVDKAEELLLEGTHGIRSRLLADELTTYVREQSGRTRPEKNKFADLLMAWMIAQYVAYQIKPRSDRTPGQVKSMISQQVRDRWLVR